MERDEWLLYRSKDVYTTVFMGDKPLYRTNVAESKFYNKSPGNLWNEVFINSTYSNQLLRLKIDMVYDSKAITIDHTFRGDKTDIILSLYADKLEAIILSTIMIIVGIVLMVWDLMPTYKQARKNHGIMWLGIFSFLMGLWSIIETNVLQFLVNDMRILQLLDNMSMIVANLPILLYLDCEYSILQNRFARILGYSNAVYIAASVFLHITGILDFHYTLPITIIMSALFVVSLFAWGITRTVNNIKRHSISLEFIFQLVGLGFLWILTSIGLIDASKADTMDRASVIRIGMLVFIVCFAISSQIETYKILEHGLKYDLVSTLAYTDGLTGLGNRTAYLEKLDELANAEFKNTNFGIVFFDINNLKKVNDNQGHDKGDELITIASKIIDDCFSKYGNTYRIGGDEFCLLMTGNDLKAKYEQGASELSKSVNEINQAKWYTYEVQIANGFSMCNVLEKDIIEATIAKADSAMYENKNLLKQGKISQ